MLQITNVTLTINQGSPLEKILIRDVSLRVLKGEFVVLIGGNGAGKSTLLNLISGALRPDRGQIFIKNTQKKKDYRVSQVMQDPKAGTMENLSILENLAFAWASRRKNPFCFYESKKLRGYFQERLHLLNMDLERRLDEPVAYLY
jgi:putative ABC transport system ATP-binding protein